MQTPISFILDLILDYELPADAQKRCRKYVRELEANLSPKTAATNIQPKLAASPLHALQSPSTQRLLEQHGQITTVPNGSHAGGNYAGIIQSPILPPAARIVGGEVNTGAGTKGPRKW